MMLKPTTKYFYGKGEPSIRCVTVHLGKNCMVIGPLMKFVENIFLFVVLKNIFCSFYIEDGRTRWLAIVCAASVSKNVVNWIGKGKPSMNI